MPDMINAVLKSGFNTYQDETNNRMANASAYRDESHENPRQDAEEVDPEGMTRQQWGGMSIDMRRDFLRSMENRVLSGETAESIGPRPWWMTLTYKEGDTKSDSENKEKQKEENWNNYTDAQQYPVG